MTKSDQQRSIAQVSLMLRSILEAETLEHFFWVSGKIDRFYKSDLGHIYFDLVDDHSSIRCMLREQQSGDLDFDLKNHLDVEVYGDIHFYERRAEAQINVLNVRVLDSSTGSIGAVDALRAEGLYPPRRKSAPARIRRIGLITSRSSRAIGDFETTYQGAGQRAVLAPLTWQYVHLEGNRAQQSIIDGITMLENTPDIDVIAIIRGGGRYENLAIFDDTDVVRAIARSPKYIVTGIGHQRDHTLSDDVADHIAATPTAAATYLADLCLSKLRPEAPAPKLKQYASQFPKAKSSLKTEPKAHQPTSPIHPEPQPSRGYNLIVLALMALAIAAVMFLGYAILQTA